MPHIGQIVLYKLNERDIQDIQQRRSTEPWLSGGRIYPGDQLPLIITRVWNPRNNIINGKVILDGADDLWVTGVTRGDKNGDWTIMPDIL